jgi:hypothetical protein
MDKQGELNEELKLEMIALKVKLIIYQENSQNFTG